MLHLQSAGALAVVWVGEVELDGHEHTSLVDRYLGGVRRGEEG